MNPHWLIFGIGIFYILIFGALSLLRREGLSTQFAIEAFVITAIVEAIAFLMNTVVDPLPFLIFLYLVTMRGRLLVDLANALSSRGRQRDAIKLLQWAMRLMPDHSTRLVIQVNMGIVQLRRKNPANAQQLFEEVLKEMEQLKLCASSTRLRLSILAQFTPNRPQKSWADVVPGSERK
jgi:hypothetical protein